MSNDPQLFDVVAVNLTTYAERTIDTGLTARDAEGLIDSCVARRGVDDETFKAVPACPAPPRMGNVAVAMVQEAAAITQESDAETSPRYRTLAWSQQGYSLYGRPTPEPPPFTPPFSAWLCAVVPAGWDVIFVRELRQIRPEDGRVDMEVTIQRRGAGAAPPEREAASCVWRLEVDEWGDSSLWHTACGREWTFTDDGPVENRMDYCHGCGTRVLVAPPETGDDDV